MSNVNLKMLSTEEPTAAQVAMFFWDKDSKWQAEFFNALGSLSSVTSSKDFGNQAAKISEHTTNDGYMIIEELSKNNCPF